MILSMYTSTLLLDSRLKLKANSYTDLGMKAFGKPGKIAVNLALALCQIGFVCAYIYFIKENLTQIFYGKELKEEDEASWVRKTIWVAVGEFFIYAMLSYVRKIQIFASTSLFGNLMIMITITAIIVYGCIHIKDQGEVEFDTVPFLNEKTYTQSIGFSVYAFEGIGLIIPVQDVTALEEPQYRKVVFLVFFSCAMIFIVFGQFCVFAWGDQI